MPRQRLIVICVLMGGVLLGLLSIQFYWIKQSVRAHERQFSMAVNDAMLKTAYILEKKDVMRFFNRTVLPQNSFIGNNEQMIFNTWFDQHNILKNATPSTVRPVLNANDSNISGHTVMLYRKQAASSPAGGDPMYLLENLILDYLQQVTPSCLTLSKGEIDTMLSYQLTNHGISAPYQFAVSDAKGNLLLKSDNYEPSNRIRHKVILFPDNIFQDPLYLQLSFPHEWFLLFKQTSVLSATSLLFMIIISGCFAYVVIEIFRQKKLAEMKTDFVNNMTHELKTPIATISFASEMLKKDAVRQQTERIEKYAGIIYEENRKLGEQVEKVLQMAIIEKGEFVLNKTEWNLNELINEVAQQVSMQIEVAKGILVLQLDAQPGVINADKMHISNVLNNLLGNAIKYSQNQLHITVTTEQAGGMIYLKVIDKGVGMTPEEQKKIFDKFYRIPTGNVHNVKGFGLGLSYVKAMIEAHEGNITVESTPGKGSTFEIVLPIKI